MSKRGGMGGQRVIIVIILVAAITFAYLYFKPVGKYHNLDCFWVHVYTQKKPKDFPTDARFIGLYKRSSGENYRVYTDRERGEIKVTGLKRCPLCGPAKP